MKKIRLKVTIRLLTPLHVGGEPGEDANTAYILRGANNQAYYPGTAFKGKVRHYAQQLQKMRNINNCRFPSFCECAVCRLFGGKGNAPGSLFFNNFHAVGGQDIELRAGNAIDRFRRVAEDEKLFTTETVVIKALQGYVTGYVGKKNISDIDEDDLKLVKDSIRLIHQIGGQTSRGLGWVDGEIEILDEQQDQSLNKESDKSDGSASCVPITLTPKSPLLIGTHTTQSNFRDTQCVIPGAVLRAAMARAICRQDGTSDQSEKGIKTIMPEDTPFRKLREAFADLRFSTLHSGIQDEPNPITTRKCKFKKNHRYVDVLAAMIINEAQDNQEKLQCPECDSQPGEGRLEKVAPYENIQNYLTKKINPNDCRLITSTHSEIDKLRGTAKDGRLFTVRAIAPKAVTFHGTISGDIDLGELSRLLRSPLHVGAMLTSGFGVCDVTIESSPEKQNDDLLDRIKRFNKLIGGKGYFIPITLMSDMVADLKVKTDEHSSPDEQGSSDLQDEYTSAYADLLKPILGEFDFEMAKVITKPRMWRGFDTSKQEGGFEKPARYLLQAGSVLVVRVDTLEAPILEKLQMLEHKGIGLDTQDGYGAVRIAHESHIKHALVLKGGKS